MIHIVFYILLFIINQFVSLWHSTSHSSRSGRSMAIKSWSFRFCINLFTSVFLIHKCLHSTSFFRIFFIVNRWLSSTTQTTFCSWRSFWTFLSFMIIYKISLWVIVITILLNILLNFSFFLFNCTNLFF